MASNRFSVVMGFPVGSGCDLNPKTGEPQTTDDTLNLRSPLQKAPDADVLRKIIGFAAERLMELEVGALTGAAPSEKSPLRLAQRNGYAH